jgi:hypothetical protein
MRFDKYVLLGLFLSGSVSSAQQGAWVDLGRLQTGAKKPSGTTQMLGFRHTPMHTVTTNLAPAESLAAADWGWMSGNLFLASEGKSVFS